MSKRLPRLEEHILEELSAIIRKEFDDPTQSFITITKVHLGKELTEATISVSVFPETNQEIVLERLNRAHGFLQAKLYERMSTYNLPKLYFKYDPSIKDAARVNQLIEEAKNTKLADSKDKR